MTRKLKKQRMTVIGFGPDNNITFVEVVDSDNTWDAIAQVQKSPRVAKLIWKTDKGISRLTGNVTRIGVFIHPVKKGGVKQIGRVLLNGPQRGGK